MQSDAARESLVAAVIEIFVSTIGFIPREEVSEQTNFIHDFNIIDDDLTVFVLEVEKAFGLSAKREDWQTVETIGQIVDLIIRCGLHPEEYPARSPGKIGRTLSRLKRKLRGDA